MGQDTPHGVTDDTSRDGAETSPSRVVVEDGSFLSKGAVLPPLLGPLSRSTRARVYHSGRGTFCLTIGGDFAFEANVWTTAEGLDALIGDLMAAKVRAEIAREQARARDGREFTF